MQHKKDVLGKILFILSILFLVYTLITPLNHLACQIDEYFTMTITNLPVQDIITVTAGDVHPPLHYLLAKIVVEISNAFNLDVLFSLKLLSDFAFLLIMIISATKIRKEYGWLTAGIFVFSLSVMSEFSIYHIIARMYSWTVLFILIAFLAFGNIVNNKDVTKSWIILTLFSIMAAYTHYFGAMTAICIYIILLAYIIKNNKDQLKNWFISTIGGIILYLPWLFVLFNQISQIKSSDIYPITLDEIIMFLGYFAYNETVIFSIISLAILIIIIAIYQKESDSFSKEDKVLILTALGAYFGTFILAIISSELFKPVLYGRYIMPAAALLWLGISIILGKIKNRKSFLITLALVSILLISGVAYLGMSFDKIQHQGQLEKEYFDNMTKDDNSIYIIGTQADLMFFLCCSPGVDTYCINVSDVFSLPSQELHKYYDYKDINETQIDELISNNTDKNIYFLYWDDTLVKSPIESEFTEFSMHYTKINTTLIENQKNHVNESIN